MYRYLFALILVFSIISCTKKNDIDGTYTFTAKIAAFDYNCNHCVLEFPDDSLKMKILVGEISDNNLYNAINLDIDNFEIGQNLEVTLRKAKPEEMRVCITLFPTYTFQNIFIIKYKSIQ